MSRVLVYSDGWGYLMSDPYQSQLHVQLERDHAVTHVTGPCNKSEQEFDAIFCAKRTRDVARNPDVLASIAGGRPVVIQDYDPWRFLPVDAPFAGGYHKIMAHVKHCRFFIPSGHWTMIAAGQNVDVVPFAPIGMSPELCAEGRPWSRRKIDLEFRGSFYPEREEGFRLLAEAGLVVPRPKTKITPYTAFLKHLENVKVWCHHESTTFLTKGVVPGLDVRTPACWLWPKTCEILSRGCFVVRNVDTEMLHYGLHDVPTLVTYDDIRDAKSKVDWILGLHEDDANSMIRDAVAKMRAKDPYRYISSKIVEWCTGVQPTSPA